MSEQQPDGDNERCEVCGEPLNDEGDCPGVQTMVDGVEELARRSPHTDSEQLAGDDES